MNTTRWVVGGAVSLLLAGTAAFAGDLNPPPGAISPTDDVVLNAQAITLPYTINQPGAYRLTSNLVGGGLIPNGIQINSNDVWLDLGGFVVDGLTPAGNVTPGDGIVVLGPYRNITILNGVVRNWGDDGIDLMPATDNRVMRVNAQANASEGIETMRSEITDCQARDNNLGGILAFDHSVVERCRATGNNGPGIFADQGTKIANCVTDQNTGDGIDAILWCVVVDCSSSLNLGMGFVGDDHTKFADCVAAQNGANGFNCFQGGVLVDCVATENANSGFFVDVGCTVTNCKASRNFDGFTGIAGVKFSECTATENQNYGFYADVGTTIRECNANLNQFNGIYVQNECEVERNHVWFNGGGEVGPGVAGIECFGSGNRVSHNDCKDNPQNYFDTFGGNAYFGNSSHQPLGIGLHYSILFPPANDVGPISKAQFGGSAWDNIIYP